MQVKNILAAAAVAALGFSAVNANAALATSTFQVQMTITSACAVTTAPTNINLGSAAATPATTGVALSGSTTFKVNCSNKTPFFIGMAPSSANGGTANGTGNMISTTAPATNTSQVPYTLYSAAPTVTAGSSSGTVWGNTATTTTKGNGVQGTGTGMASANAQSFTVWATAVNSDFAPDSYADTVTVNVNY